VNDEARIRANTAPPDAVLPEARSGFLGVVMLDTRFPRPRGDVGHPETFPWPVRYRVVRGAWPSEIVAGVQALQGSTLLPAFIEALRELEGEGARALTTSCGFLVLLQQELQAAVNVPLVSSSLLQLPALLEREERVGVLTISAQQLSQGYLRAAGVSAHRLQDVVVQGVPPQGELASAILGNRTHMDFPRAQAEVVEAALALKARAPGLREVVLECTNLPPYSEAVRKATGFSLHALPDAPALIKSFA
jgi:aspartate/glutamate racemase